MGNDLIGLIGTCANPPQMNETIVSQYAMNTCTVLKFSSFEISDEHDHHHTA